MPIAPKRRWFRLGFWVLMVLVIMISCWLWYELNWIRQRRQIVDRKLINIELLGGPLTNVHKYADAPANLPLSMRFLSWLGENPRQMTMLILYDDNGSGQLSDHHKYELAVARRLFPESVITWKLVNNL